MVSARCGARAAAALLHVNLLLAVFAGACLVMGARLRWDPTLYVPLREVLPAEYRALAVAAPAAGAALLALAHLALAAAAPRPRPALLYTYSGLTLAALALQAGALGWAAARAAAFAHSQAAAELQQALETRRYLTPLLTHLAQWYPVPDHLTQLIHEAEEDLPWNGHVAAAALAALLSLQLLGAALALLAACAGSASPARCSSRRSLVESIRYGALEQHCKLVIVWLSVDRSGGSVRSVGSLRSAGSMRSAGSASSGASAGRALLRTKYKNGRIVPV